MNLRIPILVSYTPFPSLFILKLTLFPVWLVRAPLICTLPTWTHHSLSASLLSGMTRCYRLIFHPCPSSRISHFSKETEFILKIFWHVRQLLLPCWVQVVFGSVALPLYMKGSLEVPCVQSNLCVFLLVISIIFPDPLGEGSSSESCLAWCLMRLKKSCSRC